MTNNGTRYLHARAASDGRVLSTLVEIGRHAGDPGPLLEQSQRQLDNLAWQPSGDGAGPYTGSESAQYPCVT